MQLKNISVRIVAFVALIAVLGVPAGFLAAHARQQEQQEGPTKPSPTPQPGVLALRKVFSTIHSKSARALSTPKRPRRSAAPGRC